MKYLRKSTAATVVVGPFLSNTDGVTARTALASQAGRVVKNGTGAALAAPTTWAHDGNGHYLVSLGTGDTDTVGRLRVDFADAATFCPVWEDFTVLDPAVYDVIFGTVAPSTHTAAAVAALVAAGAVAAVTGDIGGKVLGGGAGTISGTGARVVDAAGNPVAPASTALSTAQWTNARAAGLDNLDAAISTRSTYAGADTAGTTTLLTRLSAGRATNLDNLDAAVSTRLATAGYTAPPTAGVIADAVWDEVQAGHAIAGTFGSYLDAAVSSVAGGGGGGLTAAQVWDYPTTAATTAGSLGELVTGNLDATISSRSTYAGGAVASVTAPVTVGTVGDKSGYSLTQAFPANFADLAISATAGRVTAGSVAAGGITAASFAAGAIDAAAVAADALTNAELAASAVAELAAGVWDLATAGHTAAGSFGAAAIAAGNAGDPWGAALPGSYAAGTAGAILGGGLAADVWAAADRTLTAAGLDAVPVEAGLNARQALSVTAAAAAGTLAGAGTDTIVIAGAGVSTTRITAQVAGGNRTSVTLSPPA